MCVAIGLSAFLANVQVQPKFYRREVQVLAVATALFVFAAADGRFTRTDGLILLASFAIYLQLVTRVLFDFSRLVSARELSYFVEHLANIRAHITRIFLGKHKPVDQHWNKYLVRDALGLAVSALIIVVSSDQLIGSAVTLAKLFGTSSAGVGATIVSLGTTMPELSVSLASVRRGYYHMLFGNIIGSNIVNILLIGGIAALVQPFSVPTGVLLSLVLLAVATLAFIAILTRPGYLSRVMSTSMLAYYVVFAFVSWFAA
jgi:cation:H+ antiporter